MSLTPTLPAQRCRAALISRLSNATSGFNPFIVACTAGAGLTPFTIDFADDSQTFLHGKYNIEALFEDSEIVLPALALYQGPSRTANARDNLIGGVYSGYIGFGLDAHLMSTEGQSQSQFDRMVSCVHDAVINTLNFIGAPDYSAQQLVWNDDVSMGQPSRVLDQDTGQYLSTLPFLFSIFTPV
jgi:hypothetical protein